MTAQIERCLCGGDVEIESDDFGDNISWMVCKWCDYESTTYETPDVAIDTHNRMMLAARAPVVQGVETMDLAELQRFAIVQAERATKAEAQLDTMIAAHKQQIAAHKQQIADLTDALAPMEWEPGRVPTEPGWYWLDWGSSWGALPVPVMVRCPTTKDPRPATYGTGDHYGSVADTSSRWIGSVVLPQKRKG